MSLKLNKKLKEITGAYEKQAPEDAQYPYTVFDAKKVTDSEGIQTYSLEINAWDNSMYYSRAEDLMDELEKKLHMMVFQSEDMMIEFWKGRRQSIEDPDKQIKRVYENFEMKVVEKEE